MTKLDVWAKARIQWVGDNPNGNKAASPPAVVSHALVKLETKAKSL